MFTSHIFQDLPEEYLSRYYRMSVVWIFVEFKWDSSMAFEWRIIRRTESLVFSLSFSLSFSIYLYLYLSLYTLSLFRCAERKWHVKMCHATFLDLTLGSRWFLIGTNSGRQEEAVLQRSPGTERQPNCDCRGWWRERNGGHREYCCHQRIHSHYRQGSRCSLHRRAEQT